jgi:enamine deaminase RidA (YjgF/YER057c/UK114 family)
MAATDQVSYYGNPSSIISGGVVVPAGKKLHFTSGITCPVADSSAQEGTPERFGDTRTQALGILKNLQATLLKNGLTMKDVIYLRVYVTPDRFRNSVVDFKGWNEAYSQYFGTPENPTKPARSTLGIASLVSPDKFIEIELVAVYP